MKNNGRIHRASQIGFTLVEMSIVLVIIGIILASVMKGRDLIYSAKETKVEQAFFQKWRTILNDYYKGTGYVLGDGTINGGTNATVDSFADYLTFYDDDDSNKSDIKNGLRMAGINPCVLITGNTYEDDNDPKCTNNMDVFQYKVDSENVGLRTVTMGLGNSNLSAKDIDGNTTTIGQKNILLFFNLPIDYAKRIDKIIDGKSEGESGKCLNVSYNDGKGRNNITTSSAPSLNESQFGGGDRVAYYWPLPSTTTKDYLSRYYTIAIILDF